jgi:hypothetical protein
MTKRSIPIKKEAYAHARKIVDKPWDTPVKQMYRLASIVGKYRQLFGYSSIPKDRQYWTLCGKCGSNSRLDPGTELDQLLNCGFVTKEQIYGVEINPEIFKSISTIKGINWIHDDLVSAMTSASIQGNFNPSIIHYDSCKMPQTISHALGEILSLLISANTHEVLVICNTVIRTRNKRLTLNEAIEVFKRDRLLSVYLNRDWKIGEPYQYETGRIIMGSIPFFRK